MFLDGHAEMVHIRQLIGDHPDDNILRGNGDYLYDAE